MVGEIGHRLEAGEGKGGKGGSVSGTGGSNRGGDRDTRIGNGSNFRSSPHEGVDHGNTGEEASLGASGSSGAEWSGVED